MNLNIGSLFNTAANFGLGTPDSKKPNGSHSLKDYMEAMSNYGFQIKSNYEIEFTNFGGLTFMCQSITTPGLKGNSGTIYYKGREVRLPVNYEQEHDFSMTLIDDASGFIYYQVRQFLMNDYSNRKLKNGYNITVKAFGDTENSAGHKIHMEGVRIKSVGGLDYGFNSNDIATFTCECECAEMWLEYSSIKKKEGLLSKINKVGSIANSILGR